MNRFQMIVFIGVAFMAGVMTAGIWLGAVEKGPTQELTRVSDILTVEGDGPNYVTIVVEDGGAVYVAEAKTKIEEGK